jgi:hypothetical protein
MQQLGSRIPVSRFRSIAYLGAEEEDLTITSTLSGFRNCRLSEPDSMKSKRFNTSLSAVIVIILDVTSAENSNLSGEIVTPEVDSPNITSKPTSGLAVMVTLISCPGSSMGIFST